jgi:hypothetical protein
MVALSCRVVDGGHTTSRSMSSWAHRRDARGSDHQTANPHTNVVIQHGHKVSPTVAKRDLGTG